jgi:hypothetical protein
VNHKISVNIWHNPRRSESQNLPYNGRSRREFQSGKSIDIINKRIKDWSVVREVVRLVLDYATPGFVIKND